MIGAVGPSKESPDLFLLLTPVGTKFICALLKIQIQFDLRENAVAVQRQRDSSDEALFHQEYRVSDFSGPSGPIDPEALRIFRHQSRAPAIRPLPRVAMNFE
jgi:hypothetical protein